MYKKYYRFIPTQFTFLFSYIQDLGCILYLSYILVWTSPISRAQWLTWLVASVSGSTG